MIKKRLLIISVILISSFDIYSQIYVELPDTIILNEIDVLHEKTPRNAYSSDVLIDSIQFESCIKLEKKLSILMASANYIKFLNKFKLGKYYLQVNQKKKAIVIFKEILQFKFWGKYHNIKVGHKNTDESYYKIFYNLYCKTGLLLIESYEGNLEELNKLNFVVSTNPYLMPSLKKAIISAGGKWNGDSTEYNFPPNVINRIHKHSERYEKD